MVIQRGTETKEGWCVKSTADGMPYPLDSRLEGIFKKERIDTLSGAFDYGVKKFDKHVCMLTRKLIKRSISLVGGKRIEKLQLDEYMPKTYFEIKNEVDTLYHGLTSIELSRNNRVAIFAETRYEWFMAAMACLKHRITVCTLYTTLTEEGLVHALNETEANAIFTSYDQMQRVLKVLPLCNYLQKIIIMEDQLEGIGEYPSETKIEFIPFRQLLNTHIPKSSYEIPKATDIAIIMYTSGSTGVPKGVLLNHTSILTSMTAYSVQMNVGPGDRFMAFLPLAHIMELASELALVSLGTTIYYSSPHTLTNSSLKIMDGTEGDAKIGKPTVMNAVPLVLDRIMKQVIKVVNSQGWVKSFIFFQIVNYKFWLDYIPLSSTILDLMIFNKVKEELGGHLKRMIVGGAPLSPSTHHKIMAIFGCSIQVGYGSTETASCSCGMDEDDMRTGQVGSPNLGVILKLEDWQEGDYLVTDLPFPRGEIIIGGPTVANGYFKLEEQTVEAFYVENGIKWFKTGDIGELDNTGSIRIIDRKKDLVKLKNGEYVSLGNSESRLKNLPIIDNVCVFADGSQERIVAVAVPVMDNLKAIAESIGVNIETASNEEICRHPKVKNSILQNIQEHGVGQGLSKWEIPADIHLSCEAWTPDSGLVTAALKLRRIQLTLKYKNMVTEMFSHLSTY